ncbi:hypothetical protein ACFE04_008486 [Oxalis oulophora]
MSIFASSWVRPTSFSNPLSTPETKIGSRRLEDVSTIEPTLGSLVAKEAPSKTTPKSKTIRINKVDVLAEGVIPSHTWDKTTVQVTLAYDKGNMQGPNDPFTHGATVGLSTSLLPDSLANKECLVAKDVDEATLSRMEVDATTTPNPTAKLTEASIASPSTTVVAAPPVNSNLDFDSHTTYRSTFSLYHEAN